MNRQQRRAERKQSRSGQGAPSGLQKDLADGLAHHQAGRLNEAEGLYRKILAADPRHADGLHLLGTIAYQVGRHDTAAELIASAIKVSPRVAYYHCNLGLALSGQKKLDEAVACYRRALALDPHYVEAHSNLGNALLDQGKPDEAAASYRQALALKPGLAEVHGNLGSALRMQGKLDEAVACFRQAIALKPDHVDAYVNLGKALREDGKPEEALGCFRKAIELKPENVDALNNLAVLLMEHGKVAVALNAIKLSLQIKDTAESRLLFVGCVKGLRFTNDDYGIQEFFVRALTEPWCRPGVLARAGADLVKLDPDAGGCIARAAGAWPRRLTVQELFGPGGLSSLAGNKLLGALLGSSVIPDMDMERFLTLARHALLDAALDAADSDDAAAIRFYSALASQCFINEYVFSHTDDETKKVNTLRDRLTAALEANAKVPALPLLAVAAYVSLSSLPLAARLLDMQWPEPIAALLVQQISEPEQERQLRAAIPRLTKIEDDVSRLVRDQYEENPYPRWVKIEPAGNPSNIVSYLSQMFPRAALNLDGNNGLIDFLIAGCGTGQQSIGMAQIFRDARILAVDLSLGSLGYAKRKTLELGLTSIDYAQADLLELGSIGRQFDFIASVGVLHHLADPFAGWRTLLSLLRPGGFMNLGFYSELARRHIVKARAFIAERGYGGTADEIRRSRQDLMERRADFGTTVGLLDFYSTSSCRDLLFHTQEHRMTLADIDAFLRDNGLAFLGLETDRNVMNAYRRRFPDDAAATDLGRWHAFETDNPDVFIGMYQFWIQKPR